MYDMEYEADLATELYLLLYDKTTIHGLNRSRSLQSHILTTLGHLWVGLNGLSVTLVIASNEHLPSQPTPLYQRLAAPLRTISKHSLDTMPMHMQGMRLLKPSPQ